MPGWGRGAARGRRAGDTHQVVTAAGKGWGWGRSRILITVEVAQGGVPRVDEEDSDGVIAQ